MSDVLSHPAFFVLVGVVVAAVAIFALWEFFKTESEWRSGAKLWVIVVFLGFVVLAFVAATRIFGI
jgi:hypothetical protein